LNTRNILIISNRGFIGESLYNSFKINKNYHLYGLNSQNCDLLNFNKTQTALSKIITQPLTIIFLSTYGRLPNDNYEIYNKNVTMITNLLNSINNKLIEQFIFFSSACLYGRPPKNIPIVEELDCDPNGYYGLSKYVSESLIKLQLSCPISIIRIPGVYGSLDKNKSIVSSFIYQMINDKKITIYDKGEVLRDYVYIYDVIKVIKYIIDTKSNITLNIATGKSIKLIDLVNAIEIILNKKAKINYLESGYSQFDISFNIDKLLNLIPDHKPTLINNGLKELIKNKYNFT